LAVCDKLDGLEDGVISHVSACKFNPQSLRCPGGGDTADTCLSDAQIDAFDTYNTTITFGYPLGSGETQYPGFNVYAGADTRGLLQLNIAAPAPLISTPDPSAILTMPYFYIFWDGWIKNFVTRNASFDSLLFDPQNPGVYQQRVAYLTGVQDINDTDLSAFARRGGKLLLAHGTADALVSTRSTEDYYSRLLARYGKKKTRSFVRYYEAPGFGHAISGSFIPAWDSLKALEDWVERGIAPTNQVITDTRAGAGGRTRPLCEYPKWPRYKGSGDPNLASSFKCLKAPGFHGYDDEDSD
jgi:feruloyl esterase